MGRPASGARRGASALLARAFRHAHAGYLALPPAPLALLRRLWPGFLRSLVRKRLVPLLGIPAGRHGPSLLTRYEPGDPNGATLVGYLHGDFGVAENLRTVARACMAAGVQIEIHSMAIPGRDGQAAADLTHLASDHYSYATQIHCANADSMLLAPRDFLRAAHPGKYRIGNWFWELDKFPSEWRDAFDEVDELWAASPFVETVLAAASTKPVTYMPMAVDFHLLRPYTRRDFDLPENTFLCLFSYDFNSYMERKNPAAAIAAFQQAFPPAQRDAGLVIKTIGGANHPDALRRLRELARSDPRVILQDAVLARDRAYGLQSVCDVFVSLHRAEGFGLGMAEAMLLGKPVVATGYSGNLAFMNSRNSCLVDYRMVPVKHGEYPFGAGKHWAEPDAAHAAAWLRRLYQEPRFRQAVGLRAARTIRRYHSSAVVGAQIRRRLETIAAGRRRPAPAK